MSTRSAILRAGEGGGVGRYIHFDGYPTGVGFALLEIYPMLGSNFQSMAVTLIDKHPAGWSTINGDWNQEPGFVNLTDPERPCVDCGEPWWRHYRQYYADRNATPPPGPEIMVLGHQASPTKYPTDARPRCYCHGDRSESEQLIICVDDTVTEGYCTGEDCDPLSIEWAYRIRPDGLEVWEGCVAHPVTGDYAHRRIDVVPWGDFDAMKRIEEEVYG